MADVEDTTLYEEFLAARRSAIEVTDRFNATEAGDASRPELWEHVTRQTETARLLLERWLRTGKLTDELPSGTLHAMKRGPAEGDAQRPA